MELSLQGTIRKFISQALGGGRAPVRLTGYESIAVAQVEPAKLEWSRAGFRFAGGTQLIAGGIAPVADVPTTTATLALYNRDPKQSLIIEQLGFYDASGTDAAGATLLACVTDIVASPPTANAANHASSALNGGSQSSKSYWATALTIATPAWFQITSTFQAAAANLGQGDTPVDVGGAIIIPPRCALGLAILSGAGTTPKYNISAIWGEAILDLE